MIFSERFVVVGGKYLDDALDMIPLVQEGDQLFLEADPDQTLNPYRILVLWQSPEHDDVKVPIGWVANNGTSCEDCLLKANRKEKSCPNCGGRLVPYGCDYRLTKSEALTKTHYCYVTSVVTDKSVVHAEIQIGDEESSQDTYDCFLGDFDNTYF